MERSVVRFSIDRLFQRITRYRWRTPIELEWNILPDSTSLQILHKVQSDLQDRNIESENSGDRIFFMSMFNDIDWTRKGHEEKCITNFEEIQMYAKRFWQGHWTFLDPGNEQKWYRNRTYKSWKKMGFRRVKDGTTIRGNMTSNFYECQRLEPWNPEKSERKRNHSSVSTEQFQTGVDSLVKVQTRLSPFWRSSWRTKNPWIQKCWRVWIQKK